MSNQQSSGGLIPNSFQTPNAYVDDFMALLTAEEYKVLSYMARRIFGFRKESDYIGLDQFCNGIKRKDGTVLDRGTGLSKNAVRRALAELIRYGLVIELTPSNYSQASEYTLELDSMRVDVSGLETRLSTKELAGKTRAIKGLTTKRDGGKKGGVSPTDTVPLNDTVSQNDSEVYHPTIQGVSSDDTGVYHPMTPQNPLQNPLFKTNNKTQANVPVETEQEQQLLEPLPPIQDQGLIEKAVKACADLLTTGKRQFINGHTNSLIHNLITDYSPDWVIDAVGVAAGRNIDNLGYVEAVLKHWSKHAKGCQCRTPDSIAPAPNQATKPPHDQGGVPQPVPGQGPLVIGGNIIPAERAHLFDPATNPHIKTVPMDDPFLKGLAALNTPKYDYVAARARKQAEYEARQALLYGSKGA